MDATGVRVVITVAALIAGGFGAVAYVLAWLLVRSDDRDDAIIRAVRADRRGLMLATAAGTALAAIQVAGSLSGIGWLGFAAWPLGLTALGILLVWRNAPPDEQAVLRRLARQLLGLTGERSRSRVLVRATLGAVLAAAGLLTLAAPRQSTALLRPLGGTALLLGGMALVIAAGVVILGPWWLRIARDLAVERQARVRAEERADMVGRDWPSPSKPGCPAMAGWRRCSAVWAKEPR